MVYMGCDILYYHWNAEASYICTVCLGREKM